MRAAGDLVELLRRTSGVTIEASGEDGLACSMRIASGQRMIRVLVVASWGNGWDHVSVSRNGSMPTWTVLETVKRIFFRPDEWAMQLHAPPSAHINAHPFCLHLWRPQDVAIPTPPPEFV